MLPQNLRPLQLAVLAILTKATHYEWSIQGFGVLRLYIEKVGRLHIWDSELRYPNVSMVHNHSWDLRSTVVSGMLYNHTYDELVGQLPPHSHHRMKLLTGYESRPLEDPTQVLLVERPLHFYQPGDSYAQSASWVHKTDAVDGTITLMERQEDENGEAYVYWPLNTQWGDAKPRMATTPEITRTVERALELLRQTILR